MTLGERKQKIKALMIEHLRKRGYPDMENDAILKELKPMWIKLEESGLLLKGMTFHGFSAQAHAQARVSTFNDLAATMAEFMKGFGV